VSKNSYRYFSDDISPIISIFKNKINNFFLIQNFSNTLLVCVVIKKDLAGALSIAVTTDVWTSCQNLAYVAITVHFINE